MKVTRTIVRDLNTPRMMPEYRTLEDWLARAKELRKGILVSCGLYPLPGKCPINAQVFDKRPYEGYTVEKVYFESYPEFFVTGNLYRPAGTRRKAPGILSPHGHWLQGRLGDDPVLGSVPGRCITLARQGYVVFSYDMVGYNDSIQVSHRFGDDLKALWGLSLMGLQLWNSLRAVDFLCSLPEVDSKRIGCTGESGGGTQTFMLMAVEPRIAAAVPVNMISAHFQGGCLCENAPNLRVDTFNVEIAALMAPRPMLMVSATGDWTKDTPRVEYPAVRRIYELFNAVDRVACVQFNAPHNYNKDSREAMYAWFGRWFSGEKDKRKLREQPFSVELVRDVLVFYGRQHPRQEVNEQTLSRALIQEAREQLESLKPVDRKSHRHFQKTMEPALRHALSVELSAPEEIVTEREKGVEASGHAFQFLTIGRKGKGDAIPATIITPHKAPRAGRGPATLVVHPEGRSMITGGKSAVLHPLAVGLIEREELVLTVDCFNTGDAIAQRDVAAQFFTTYNRTDTALRVQDILTSLSYLRSRSDVTSVSLVGLEEAGLWCLLAKGLVPFVERAVVDVSQFDGSEEAFLRHLFVPSLCRVGDLQTAATLTAPKPLFLHNTGKRFDTERIAEVYRSLEAGVNLRVEKRQATAASIAEWVCGWNT